MLDRLIDLREILPNEKVLQELVMDIIRVLSTTDYEVRKKILQLALDLASNKNVQEMVMFLKKVYYNSNKSIFKTFCAILFLHNNLQILDT